MKQWIPKLQGAGRSTRIDALHPLVLTVLMRPVCQGLRIRDLNFNPSQGLRPQAMS